jgi:mono/diheme cytochrome c family protein
MKTSIAFLCAAFIAGCTSAANTSASDNASASPGASAGAPTSSAAKPTSGPDAAIANGRAIFLTGRDSAGVKIAAVPPPLRTYCAACHRADGSGGMHLPGGAISADLRHKAMVTDQKHPYTLALFERAIAKGIDNDGKPLDPAMPHWRMSRRDLHDVAEYVLTKL